MELSKRQKEIIEIVKNQGPISSKNIADQLGLSRATIRSDLSILSMLKILDAKPNVGYYLLQEDYQLREIERLYKKDIKEIMSDPIHVEEKTSIYDTIVKMFLEDVGSIVVLNENKKLSGVISRKDLLKMSIGQSNLKNTPVSLAMTRRPKIITVNPEATFIDAARKIRYHKIDFLPVINENDEVIGRISKTTIIRSFVDYVD
ncbi:MAG TPA: helix-turn-helix transcriptional regulator [Halanaerobiales bacterium]|nr:helix-turn-helix transcriptional regulator [Halanaerobiales bacterium]